MNAIIIHLNFADVSQKDAGRSSRIGSDMSLRWEYEEHGYAEKARLGTKALLRWRSRAPACIFDKKSGVRLELREDEQAALEPLIGRMSNGSTPTEVAIAFDLMADALSNRRLGYPFEWDRLANRSASEWDAWLNERLRPLRW